MMQFCICAYQRITASFVVCEYDGMNISITIAPRHNSALPDN
jgi:hypothetical protein